MKTGIGLHTYKDGTTYEGDFRKNLFHGNGTMKWADGKKYDGKWKGNNMHG